MLTPHSRHCPPPVLLLLLLLGVLLPPLGWR
jgi:hypothetical protein